MRCPKCGSGEIKVNESRDLEGESAIRRRRSCNSCSHRFTTYERIEIPSLTVIKKDGNREAYQREKIAAGVKRAFEKRPFDELKIEEIIEGIERDIMLCGCTEIVSAEIGGVVLAKIKTVDQVAYLRFASVYKSFEDLEMFRKELEIIGDNNIKA